MRVTSAAPCRIHLILRKEISVKGANSTLAENAVFSEHRLAFLLPVQVSGNPHAALLPSVTSANGAGRALVMTAGLQKGANSKKPFIDCPHCGSYCSF